MAEVNKKITCYVLQNYSRSNALIVDAETRRLQLAPALDPLVIAEHKEKASVLFLQHHDEKNLLNPPAHNFPPRLLRLIELLDQYPQYDIELVPVTVLWGRSPDKEDSWFKLLFTDTWATRVKSNSWLILVYMAVKRIWNFMKASLYVHWLNTPKKIIRTSQQRLILLVP